MVREWALRTHPDFEAGDRGTEYSNPVLSGHTLVFGSQSRGLISLYPGVNQVRWVLPVANGIMSEILSDSDRVYFGGGDGYLYCVDAENGKVLWRYQVRGPVVSKPTVGGGRLFATTADDTVYAFDAASGQWLWHYRRRSDLPATLHGASAPLVDGNDVIAGLSDGFVVALNVNDGTLKWERKVHDGRRFTDVDAHPVLDSGVLYVPSYDGALYALNRKDGEILWKFDAGGSRQVVIEGGRLYLPSSDGFVYALQKDNARVIWKFELDGGTPTSLAVTDRYLVFGASQQYLYAVDKLSGEAVYRFDAGYGSGFTGSPAYDSAKERVYILSGAGNLYAFALRRPQRKVRRLGSTDPYVFWE